MGSMLYALTVFCLAYRLYRYGKKLSREQAREGAAEGHLSVWGNVFDRSPTAELLATFSARGDHYIEVFPPMSRVRLLKVSGPGLMLYGTERVVVSTGSRRTSVDQQFAQAWWCMPTHPTA